MSKSNTHSFEVTGSPLTFNGKLVEVGKSIQLSAADGKIISDLGRVKPGSAAAKAAAEPTTTEKTGE